MISIKKDFEAVPNRLLDSNRSALILDSLVTKSSHNFKKNVYRNTILAELETLYFSKCAYCETNTSAGAPMQVEHYRPKKKVTEDLTHPGYYWLTYEWSNLILCCSKCNRAKSSYFPIMGKRVVSPLLGVDGLPTDEFRLANSLSLKGEQPLLLHPEVDDVESQFLFNTSGEIVALSPRANETIRICGLNRKELVFKRLSILNEIRDEVQQILKNYLDNQISSDQCRDSIKRVFKKLALRQNPKNDYSRFGYFIFEKFKIFIADSLAPKQNKAVTELFDEFLKGTL
jgi:uncharacterized protein (TIGR02646 family)